MNTSSFSNSPSNTTVALHSEYLTIWFIGRGDTVRYVTVTPSDYSITMAQARGSAGLEIMVDATLTPAQARRHYTYLMSKNNTHNLGFVLDPEKYERNGVEYFLTYIKTNAEAKNPEFIKALIKA